VIYERQIDLIFMFDRRFLSTFNYDLDNFNNWLGFFYFESIFRGLGANDLQNVKYDKKTLVGRALLCVMLRSLSNFR